MPKPRENNFEPDVRNAAFERNRSASSFRGAYWCVWCLQHSSDPQEFAVDHIIPASRYGALGDGVENACILCKPCNAKKLNNLLVGKYPTRYPLRHKDFWAARDEIERVADVLAIEWGQEIVARRFIGRPDL